MSEEILKKLNENLIKNLTKHFTQYQILLILKALKDGLKTTLFDNKNSND